MNRDNCSQKNVYIAYRPQGTTRGANRGVPGRGSSPCRRRERLSSSLSFPSGCSRWSAVAIVPSAVADIRSWCRRRRRRGTPRRGTPWVSLGAARLNADRGGVARETRGRRRPLPPIPVSSYGKREGEGGGRGVAPAAVTEHLSPRLSARLSVPLLPMPRTRGPHSHKRSARGALVTSEESESESGGRVAPRRTAPRRTAPHRTAPHRTAPHQTTRHTRDARRSPLPSERCFAAVDAVAWSDRRSEMSTPPRERDPSTDRTTVEGCRPRG